MRDNNSPTYNSRIFGYNHHVTTKYDSDETLRNQHGLNKIINEYLFLEIYYSNYRANTRFLLYCIFKSQSVNDDTNDCTRHALKKDNLMIKILFTTSAGITEQGPPSSLLQKYNISFPLCYCSSLIVAFFSL